MPNPSLLPVHDAFAPTPPEAGIALCLSGGGYRAMVFHAGSLWRLNESGLLGTIKRISSVSGGSITSAILGMNWSALGLSPQAPSAPRDKFIEHFVAPVRQVASETIDEGAIFGGIFLPGTISDHVNDKYDSIAFHGKTLQDLPDDSVGPRFVINATNVQSGVLMRFSKPYMADYRVGQVLKPALPLSRAVAASSAFPPILSPCEIDLAQYGMKCEQMEGTDLHMEPYITKLVLTDGGVYDNLGLETAYKRYDTLLVSDGGGHLNPDADPHTDWARHAVRVLDIIDSQVGALRSRQLIGLFEEKARKGSYWGIRQPLSIYGTTPPLLPCPPAATAELAATATRLQKMDDRLQERLINWGYALCDASLRKYYVPDLKPGTFPYPDSPI